MAGTTNSWNNQIAGSYNQILLNAGTNGVAISTDASAATVNISTGGAVKTSTFGSTNSTSTTTVQSGSGALNITSTNGAQTHNSGTGAMGISTDASATTVNIATGAAAKTVSLGSTNSTSSLALKFGTSDFSMASATGNIMVALDTGEITYPLQPAFFAYAASSQTNVTGDGTLYTCTFTTEVFDQNSDFDGTSTFTAPVTGKYFFNSVVYLGDLVVANTARLTIVTTGGTAQPYYEKAVAQDTGFLGMNGNFFFSMTAGDTCVVKVFSNGGTKIVDVVGAAAPPFYSTFGGYLVC